MTLAPATPLKALLILLLTLLCAVEPPPATASERALKKASFIPLWSPQAQFAGYYTALDKGIYLKYGIDLTIIPGGPDSPASEYLRNGQVDFAALWLTTAIQERASGVKLVHLSQIVQQSSMMLVAKKTSGITKPAEMNGKKVGLWGGPFAIPPHAFFQKYGLQVREIPQSYTVNLFLRGGIDVASAMWYNEYHTILNSGIDPDDLNVYLLKDYGVNLPEDGLYALEKTIQNDPALTKAFVQASLEGWNYAFAHPDQALDIIIKYMRAEKIPANRVHQKWMLERMRDLILPKTGEGGIGFLNRSDYQAAGQVLLKDHVISTLPDFETFTGGANALK